MRTINSMSGESKQFCVVCSKATKYFCKKCLDEKISTPLPVCQEGCLGKCWTEHYTNWHTGVNPQIPEEKREKKEVYSSEPIQVIEVRNISEDPQFLLVPRALEFFRTLAKDDNIKRLKVVVIQGMARQGKSSRLNWLLEMLGEETSKKFPTAAGSNPVTTGISVWGKPILLPQNDEEKDEEKEYLLLMDCEGTQRGRDSVTAVLCQIATKLSSCALINVRGGLTNGVMNFVSRLCVSPHTTRQNLIFCCGDISRSWLRETGDLQKYFDEFLATCPVGIWNFSSHLVTSSKPSDEDLKLTSIRAVDNSFTSSIKIMLNQIINIIKHPTTISYVSSPKEKGEILLEKLVTVFNEFTSGHGHLPPSLVEHTQRQELEFELNNLLNCFQENCRLYEADTFLLSSELTSSQLTEQLEDIKNEYRDAFITDCKNLGFTLSPDSSRGSLLDEYVREAEEKMTIILQSTISKKRCKELEILREQEEKERKEREETIRRQKEEEKRIAARVAAEQERLRALQQAEHNAWLAMNKIHDDIQNKHLAVCEDFRRSGSAHGKGIYTTCPCSFCVGKQWMIGWHRM